MEFDEHDDQEEEEEHEEHQEAGITVPSPEYNSLSKSATMASKMDTNLGESGGVPARKGNSAVKYRECLKNHAVSIGGHSVDGCGEFMAAGEEGTLDALKCAACNCHRNFHRKQTEGEVSLFQLHQQHYHNHQQYQQQLLPYYYRTPPPASDGYLQPHYHIQPPLGIHHLPQHRPLALPAAEYSGGVGGHCREEEGMSNPSSSGGGGGSGSRTKRFRTKFTREQKDKMLAFAERLGWRIQKHDDVAVEQLCAEIGVKRHAFKVWMHNNKHILSKKPSKILKSLV